MPLLFLMAHYVSTCEQPMPDQSGLTYSGTPQDHIVTRPAGLNYRLHTVRTRPAADGKIVKMRLFWEDETGSVIGHTIDASSGGYFTNQKDEYTIPTDLTVTAFETSNPSGSGFKIHLSD